MVESLDEYLATEYHDDAGDIADLEQTLERTANVFIYSCDNGRWPYEFSNKDLSPGSRNVSQGTQAMIAAALAKMCGASALASGRQPRLKLNCRKELTATLLRGFECLLGDIEQRKKLISSSFGTDDPVTLSHIADLLRGIKDSREIVGVSNYARLERAIKPAVANLTSLRAKDPSGETALLNHLPTFHTTQPTARRKRQPPPNAGRKPNYLINAFVPLRVVRAADDLAKASNASRNASRHNDFHKKYRRFFESTLHDQLSFSAIPDSRFDPAELIFCLEGLMLCAPQVVEERLFERVLEVLKDAQEASAYWRANKPLFATPQGMTMLPISVEGAVSLLRSVALMDAQSDYQRFSSLAVPMARRFWHWLRARMVKFDATGPSPLRRSRTAMSTFRNSRYKSLTGWQSEHVNDPTLIHLWNTSQVAEFMLAYRELLERSVAGRTLKLSRLQINVSSRQVSDNWRSRWNSAIRDFEPCPGAKRDRQIYHAVRADFVEPWGTRKPINYSMLVYGPPGTGKSTLAENIAKALGLRMITVTVSDFLGTGGANVEARAKAIFQTLEAQSDTVILFDEIDSFLFDRDTELYRRQDTLFQFLTPGMLTKINDLRKKARSIFIIATNYENRIDPAIKRSGRIDKKYLLQLPNRNRRLRIAAQEANLNDLNKTMSASIAANSLFFGYSDIKVAVEDAKQRGGGPREVEESIRCKRVPATSLESYLRRFNEENFPTEEFVGLLQLHREVAGTYRLDPSRDELPRGEAFWEFVTKLRGKLSASLLCLS